MSEKFNRRGGFSPMTVIGLTGPSGSGKGYVSLILARHGIPSIDTDGIYHGLISAPSPCVEELVARFGGDVCGEDGGICRATLSSIVFDPAHPEALRDLNRITHRHVLAEVRRACARLREEGHPAVLVDAPQLFESGFDTECDLVLAVLAPREVRLGRILERDGLTAERAEARLNAQKPDSFFYENADLVLLNDGRRGEAEVEAELISLLGEQGVRL